MMIDEDTGETIDPRELQGQWGRQDAEINSQNIWAGFGLDSYDLFYTTPNWSREYMGVWDSYGTIRTNPCVEVPLGPRQMKLLIGDKISIIDVPEVDGDYFIEMENQKDIKECFFCGGELSKQGFWNVCCECDNRK